MIRSFVSSIRARLLLLVLIAILPALALSIYTLWTERQEAMNEAKSRVLRIARRLSSNQRALIEGARQLLVGLAELPEVRRLDSSACSATFSRLHKEFPAYTGLNATKPNGDLFCSSIPYSGPLNFADRLWFKQVIETRAFSTGQYVVGRITGKPVLLMVYPVLDKAGQVRAVVGASLGLDWLSRFGAETGLSPKSNFIAFDTSGLVLGYYPEPEKWAGKPVRTTSLYETILSDKDWGTAETGIAEMKGPDGISRVYAFAPVRTARGAIDAYVAVGIPKEELFAAANRDLGRNLALVLIISLAAFAVAWFAGEFLVRRPAANLITAAKQIASGNLGYRADIGHGQGEIHEVGRVFNDMAESLQRNQVEQRQAIDEIEASEERFRAITETAKNAIVVADSTGNIVYWNKGAQETFGYTPHEILGQPIIRLVPEPYRDRCREAWERYRSTGETTTIGKTVESIGLRKDGSQFPLEHSVTAWRTAKGSFYGGIFRNITERKRNEQILRDSALRYRTLFEASPSGISLRDPETTLPIDFNPQAHLQLGYSKAEFARLRISDYEAIETTEKIRARVGRVLRGGRDDFETKHRTKQGELRNVLVTIQKLDLSGRPVLHCIVRDITNLKREQEKVATLAEIDKAITSTLELKDVLTLLLEKIGALLPYTAAAVMLLNKVTGELEPEAARNINEQIWKEHMRRIRAGSFLGKRILETRTPLAIANLLTDPRPRDREFFRREGLVSYVGIPLIVKDQTLGMLSIYSKEEHEFGNEELEFLTALAGQAAIAIHNAQLYEEVSNLARQLAQANNVKSEFLSVMSHELRTPLNVVMGYTGMLMEGMLGEVKPAQGKALEKILHQARDQLAMVNNILQTTHFEAEKPKVESHEIALPEFLDNLRQEYELSTEKELALIWNYPPDLPLVRTDGGKLKQILQNLINNALKFTGAGSVTVSARLAEFPVPPGTAAPLRPEPDEQGAWVEFKITDTGIGIPKESIPTIFGMFRQVDSSETRPYGGVGLGLYIVKKFTELLGGTVAVESEPGKGSTFTITLPLGPAR